MQYSVLLVQVVATQVTEKIKKKIMWSEYIGTSQLKSPEAGQRHLADLCLW